MNPDNVPNERPRNPWAGPEGEEFTPTVDCEHLKRAWNYIRERRSEQPRLIGIGQGLWEQILPGANIDAVTYRNGMLALLKHFITQIDEHRSEADPELVRVTDRLREWLSGNTFDDAVFAAMSRIPLKWMKPEGSHGLPFDVEGFLAEVEAA